MTHDVNFYRHRTTDFSEVHVVGESKIKSWVSVVGYDEMTETFVAQMSYGENVGYYGF